MDIFPNVWEKITEHILSVVPYVIMSVLGILGFLARRLLRNKDDYLEGKLKQQYSQFLELLKSQSVELTQKIVQAEQQSTNAENQAIGAVNQIKTIKEELELQLAAQAQARNAHHIAMMVELKAHEQKNEEILNAIHSVQNL